jgi:hypothetical protein
MTGGALPQAREEADRHVDGRDLPPVLKVSQLTRSASAIARFAGAVAEGFVRSDFLAALNRLQKVKVSHSRGPSHPILLNHCDGDEQDRVALRFVVIPYKLAGRWQYTAEERPIVEAKIRAAHDLIERTDPELYRGLNAVIGAYLLGKAASEVEGGSVSKLIGVIWIGLDVTRPVEDFAELIVHEYVHNALFIDDMVNALFVGGEGLLGLPENCVVSAIRQIARGYDKGFHSAYVAAVLARFFLQSGDVTKARAFITPTVRTVGELLGKPHLLFPAGQERLKDLDKLVRAIAASVMPAEPC